MRSAMLVILGSLFVQRDTFLIDSPIHASSNTDRDDSIQDRSSVI